MEKSEVCINRISIRNTDFYINYASNRGKVINGMCILMMSGIRKEDIDDTLNQAKMAHRIVSMNTKKLMEIYNMDENNHQIRNRIDGILIASNTKELYSILNHLMMLDHLAKKLD